MLGAIVSSASSVERTFSQYGFQWTKVRNRLKSYTAFQLVFVRTRLIAAEKAAKSSAPESSGSLGSFTWSDDEGCGEPIPTSDDDDDEVFLINE